jgi:uncharacterized membrane protein
MRTIGFFLSAFLIVGAAGCTKRSEPGGPGTAKATHFTLSGPSTSTSIKQGETQTETLKIERGKDFKQDVALKAEAPAGVDAELSSTSNKASEKGDVNIKITATDKAAVGEHIIHVIGTPDTGTPTKLDVKIKILARAENAAEKTTLSLHGPLLATTIKQGETKTIPLNLKQSGGKYAGNVKLNVENPQKGITADLTNSTIKAADSGEVGLKISVNKNASLGEHTLRIVGTPDTGTVAPADVKLNVVAP